MKKRGAVIRGAGGGKGGGGGQELPDSIRSVQTADVLDLLCEGEIEGLTFGLRSIYLDQVPLQNADESFNFEGVQVQFTPGTQGQAAIAGADGVLTEVPVAVTVLASTPVVRSISNPAIDRVQVTIDVAQLTLQNAEDGNLVGSAFDYAIDVQSNGGGFVNVLTDRVEGKTTSRYTRSKSFALPGSAPWDIRLRRITPDSTSSLEVNAFRWASYTQVQSLKLRYPNSALVRLRVGAQQFGRVPTRAYDIMGARVRVPTNYNPRTKAYTGVWDGTFKIDWTDCPAWIYYDLVTSNRYGLGRYFQVTPALKWRMYSIGRYCDELVPDGKGGTEPRFKCGLYLATREQAYKVLSDLAAIFRGMCFWAGTDLAVVQDAPQDPVALFTNANVEGGKFNYTGSSNSKRHSQVVVWFNDINEFGKLVPEVVIDPVLQARRGVRSLELSPLGIWSRGQAQRLGKWVLYSEQMEDEGETHAVGNDGVLVQPGSVYKIADANEARERLGGRVRSATTTAVTLDAEVTLDAGEAYTLSCMLQDPADPARLMVQKRPVTTAAGARQVLTVFPAFSSAPAAQTVWLLEGTTVQATTWRCMGVVPKKDNSGFEIIGVRHEPAKYALIEQGIAFEPARVTRMKRLPPAPASLNFTETIYALGLERRSKVTLSWPEPARGLTYLTSWRLDNGPWTDLAPTSENCVEIDALPPGLLEVSVKSRNAIGALSATKVGSTVVAGNQVAVGANLVDATWWRPGAAFEWPVSDDPAGESSIIWGTGPRGTVQALWRAIAAGPAGTGLDGGWGLYADPNDPLYPKARARVRDDRTYRFAQPVMRLSGSGQVYFGPNYQDGALPSWERVCALNSSVPQNNPFFFGDGLPEVGRWYLIVGYVYPADSTGVSLTSGGVFDMETGDRVLDSRSFCWVPGATDVTTRAFQFAVPSGSQVLFAPPTVELVDGTDGGWQIGARGQDGASSFTLVTSGGCDTPGPDRIRKPIGASAWDSDARSLESFVGGAWVSWQCERTDRNLMVGLNSDPAANASYLSLDYAWFCSSGPAHIFENGGYVQTYGAYSTDDVFLVQYDGQKVRYFVNGVLVREVAAAAGLRLYLDSSFNDAGAEVRNVRFGPVGSAGAAGAPGADARLLTLLATAQAFTFGTSGAASPSGQVITLTAQAANLTGTPAFTATGFDASGTSLGALALSGAGNTRTMSLAQFGAAARAVVQVSLGGYTDQLTLVRLRDGAAGENAVTGYLTNESHTVATEADGTGGSYGTAGGDFKVFSGLTELTSGVTFSVVVGTVNGLTGLTIGADGVYSLSGCTTDVGTATLRAVIGAVTIDKVYTLSKSRAGQAASNAARPNLLKNGGFELEKAGWNGGQLGQFAIQDSFWGRTLVSTSIISGTGAIESDRFEVAPGEKYVVHGDALCFAAAGLVYFDMLFYDGAGAVVLDGPQNAKAASFDFSASDANREQLAVEATAPATAVTASVRFVWQSLAACTALGCRLIKAERGALPYSVYTSESATAQIFRATAKLLKLLATAQAFTFDSSGSPVPPSQGVTVTAALSNLTGAVSFGAQGFDGAGVSLGGLALTGSGDSRTLTIGNFGASAYSVITATLGSYSDQVTVVRLRDGAAGANPVTGFLTNEAHTVATAANGSGGDYSSAGGDFKVFSGLTELTSGVTYSVVSGSVSGISGLVISPDGVYAMTGTTADVGTATLRAVVGSVVLDKVYTIARSRSGTDGLDGLDGTPGASVFVGTVYQQASSEPTAPTGGSFNFSTGVLTAPAGWQASRPAFNPAAATFAVDQTFTASAPGSTVAGGAWSSPRKLDGGAANSAVPSWFASGNVVAFSPADSSAGIALTLLNNGTIQQVRQGVVSIVGNWYVPTTAGIGSQYSVLARLSGDALTPSSATLDVPFPINSQPGYGLNQASLGEKSASLDLRIIRTATGVVEGTGSMSLYAALET